MKRKVIIAGYVIAVVSPLLLGFGYSLGYSLGLVGSLGKGFTLQHWERLIANHEALGSIGYTVYLALASLILSVAIALAISYWLTFNERQSKWLYNALFLPLAVPPLIAAFAFAHAISPSGLLSRIGYWLGVYDSIEAFPRLINDKIGLGIIMAHIFMVAPFFSIIFRQMASQERLPDLRKMSSTLGASHRFFAFRVFVPVLLKKASPLMLLYGIFFFGTYEVPLLLGRQSPQAITIFITEKMDKFDLMNIPVGHAMAVVYTLIVGLLATLLLRKLEIRD